MTEGKTESKRDEGVKGGGRGDGVRERDNEGERERKREEDNCPAVGDVHRE